MAFIPSSHGGLPGAPGLPGSVDLSVCQRDKSRLRRLIGDGGYAGEDVASDAARHGATFGAAARPCRRRDFTPVPLRWRIEQALGVLTIRDRRLVRDWK